MADWKLLYDSTQFINLPDAEKKAYLGRYWDKFKAEEVDERERESKRQAFVRNAFREGSSILKDREQRANNEQEKRKIVAEEVGEHRVDNRFRAKTDFESLYDEIQYERTEPSTTKVDTDTINFTKNTVESMTVGDAAREGIITLPLRERMRDYSGIDEKVVGGMLNIFIDDLLYGGLNLPARAAVVTGQTAENFELMLRQGDNLWTAFTQSVANIDREMGQPLASLGVFNDEQRHRAEAYRERINKTMEKYWDLPILKEYKEGKVTREQVIREGFDRFTQDLIDSGVNERLAGTISATIETAIRIYAAIAMSHVISGSLPVSEDITRITAAAQRGAKLTAAEAQTLRAHNIAMTTKRSMMVGSLRGTNDEGTTIGESLLSGARMTAFSLTPFLASEIVQYLSKATNIAFDPRISPIAVDFLLNTALTTPDAIVAIDYFTKANDTYGLIEYLGTESLTNLCFSLGTKTDPALSREIRARNFTSKKLADMDSSPSPAIRGLASAVKRSGITEEQRVASLLEVTDTINNTISFYNRDVKTNRNAVKYALSKSLQLPDSSVERVDGAIAKYEKAKGINKIDRLLDVYQALREEVSGHSHRIPAAEQYALSFVGRELDKIDAKVIRDWMGKNPTQRISLKQGHIINEKGERDVVRLYAMTRGLLSEREAMGVKIQTSRDVEMERGKKAIHPDTTDIKLNSKVKIFDINQGTTNEKIIRREGKYYVTDKGTYISSMQGDRKVFTPKEVAINDLNRVLNQNTTNKVTKVPDTVKLFEEERGVSAVRLSDNKDDILNSVNYLERIGAEWYISKDANGKPMLYVKTDDMADLRTLYDINNRVDYIQLKTADDENLDRIPLSDFSRPDKQAENEVHKRIEGGERFYARTYGTYDAYVGKRDGLYIFNAYRDGDLIEPFVTRDAEIFYGKLFGFANAESLGKMPSDAPPLLTRPMETDKQVITLYDKDKKPLLVDFIDSSVIRDNKATVLEMSDNEKRVVYDIVADATNRPEVVRDITAYRDLTEEQRMLIDNWRQLLGNETEIIFADFSDASIGARMTVAKDGNLTLFVNKNSNIPHEHAIKAELVGRVARLEPGLFDITAERFANSGRRVYPNKQLRNRAFIEHLATRMDRHKDIKKAWNRLANDLRIQGTTFEALNERAGLSRQEYASNVRAYREQQQKDASERNAMFALAKQMYEDNSIEKRLQDIYRKPGSFTLDELRDIMNAKEEITHKTGWSQDSAGQWRHVSTAYGGQSRYVEESVRRLADDLIYLSEEGRIDYLRKASIPETEIEGVLEFINSAINNQLRSDTDRLLGVTDTMDMASFLGQDAFRKQSPAIRTSAMNDLLSGYYSGEGKITKEFKLSDLVDRHNNVLQQLYNILPDLKNKKIVLTLDKNAKKTPVSELDGTLLRDTANIQGRNITQIQSALDRMFRGMMQNVKALNDAKDIADMMRIVERSPDEGYRERTLAKLEKTKDSEKARQDIVRQTLEQNSESQKSARFNMELDEVIVRKTANIEDDITDYRKLFNQTFEKIQESLMYPYFQMTDDWSGRVNANERHWYDMVKFITGKDRDTKEFSDLTRTIQIAHDSPSARHEYNKFKHRLTPVQREAYERAIALQDLANSDKAREWEQQGLFETRIISEIFEAVSRGKEESLRKAWDRYNVSEDTRKDINRAIDILKGLNKEDLNDFAKVYLYNELRNETNKVGEFMVEMGMIEEHNVNWLHRSWQQYEERKGKRKPVIPSVFTEYTPTIKQRHYTSIAEGWANGEVLNFDGFLTAYEYGVMRSVVASSNRELMNMGKTLGLFSDKQLPGYKAISANNFNTMFSRIQTTKATITDPETGESKEVVDRGIHTFDGKVFAPKVLANKLNNLFSRSWAREVPVLRAILKTQAEAKQLLLGFSPFHSVAVSRSYLIGGRFDTIKDANILDAYKVGSASMKMHVPELNELKAQGFTISEKNISQDFKIGSQDIFRIDSDINKTNDPKLIRKWKWMRNEVNSVREWQFGKWIPSIKSQAALLEYRHQLHKNKEALESGLITREQIAREVAIYSNNDFGGLHLGRMYRHKNMQDLFRFLSLAPDWTESNLRMMFDQFKKGLMPPIVDAAGRMMPNPEKADVSGEEYEKMFKGYFHRLALQRYLARAVATSQLWNLLMSVYSDDPQDDYWNLLQDANKKKQPNIALNYNISPLLADIFPQYAGARMYLNLIGHFNDPVRAATQTVNFAVGKKSLVAKAALELSTGEDWRGQKYKPIDDYITSVFDVFRDNLWDGLKDVSLTADYGEYVPYYDSSLQTPTVLLGQLQGILPIPVQALIGISLGEGDALDFTQRISQATGVRVIATPAEQNLKRRQRFYAELWREGKITPEQEKRWKEISRELGEIQRRKEEMKKWDEEPFWMEGL